MTKVLHIVNNSHIINDYINFILEKNNLNKNINHIFINWTKLINFLKFIKELYLSDKIILHSISFPKIIFILFLNPWLLKKCYWVIWWWDLYYHNERPRNLKNNFYEFIRKNVIKKIWNFITYIKWDYDLAKKWYWINWKYHKCIMYQSNLYKNCYIINNSTGSIKILVWNSSTDSNNHKEIFDKLKKIKSYNIKIIVPLTYWNGDYRKNIVKLWKSYFWDKFIPLINFMNNEDYVKMLSTIDIAIFNHKRQQAMWNTISLLWMWKIVYIRSDNVQWKLFNELKLDIYDIINDFDKINNINLDYKLENNKNIISKYFSEKNLINQWSKIFNN